MAKTKSVHELLESHDFKALVAKRWSVSVILCLALFVIYYGYILLIGYNKELLGTRLDATAEFGTTIGIPLGVATIILSWALTVIYVIWANNSYDPEVQRLKDQLK